MPAPASFDAGGQLRYVVDTTMAYVNRSNINVVINGNEAVSHR